MSRVDGKEFIAKEMWKNFFLAYIIVTLSFYHHILFGVCKSIWLFCIVPDMQQPGLQINSTFDIELSVSTCEKSNTSSPSMALLPVRALTLHSTAGAHPMCAQLFGFLSHI